MDNKKFNADPLKYVLSLAYTHAMGRKGKGMQRHGSDLPFRDQISCVITRLVGPGYPLGQALKKQDEAQRLERDAAVLELLGAINYLAIEVINLMEQREGE